MTNNQLLMLLICLTSTVVVVASQENKTNLFTESERGGKVFSLFSIVTFKNSGCRTQSTMTSGQSTVRNGTCFTSSECANKGGVASGNCAAGFGVCCLFLVSISGGTINQNCTYIRNPGFPSAYSPSSAVSYTIQKCSADICYLRLDFETFTTVGPTDSLEGAAAAGGAALTGSHVCPDTFKVTTNTGTTIPTICGLNTGQHIYVDMGTLSTDTTKLDFTFGATASSVRAWEIKVSQITCSNPNRPPNGCLQYWTTLTGRMTTFNFLSATGSSHLPSQSYSQCIRRAAGYCCIQYQVCMDQTYSFSLDARLAEAAGVSLINENCIKDYIAIPGASVSGCSTKNNSVADKFCGYYLAAGLAVMANAPVCDCSDPFEVYVRTNSAGDAGAVGAELAPLALSRGICLDYTQIPCTS